MASTKNCAHRAKTGGLERTYNYKFLSSRNRSGTYLACISIIVLMFFNVSASHAKNNSSVIIIANKNISEESLTLGAVRSIFGMRLRSWKGNNPIRVFVFNDHHPLHIEFSKKILGVFPHQLRWSWDRLVFSGTGQAPTYVKTEKQMLEYIENIPGAIGYITRSHGHGHVKELPVIKD